MYPSSEVLVKELLEKKKKEGREGEKKEGREIDFKVKKDLTSHRWKREEGEILCFFT